MGLTMSTEICGHRLSSSPPQWSLGEASTDIDEPLPLIRGASAYSYRDGRDVAIAVVNGNDKDDDEYTDEVQQLHVYDYYKRPPHYSGSGGAESVYKRKLSESTDGSCDGRSPLSVNSTDERDDEFNTDSTDDDCSPINTVRTRFPVAHYSHAFHNDTTAPASSASAHNALTRSYPYHADLRSSPADAAPRAHPRHHHFVQHNGGAIHHSHSEHTLQRPRYYSATRPPSSSSSVPTSNSSSISLSSLASPSSLDEDEKGEVDSDDDEASPPLRSRSLLQMPRVASLVNTSVDMDILTLSTSRSPMSVPISSPDSPENCPRTLLSFMRAQRGIPLTL